MPPVSSELEAVLSAALAAGDDALAANTLGELGRRQLAAGEGGRALRSLRSAAAHAAPLGEGALGRALGDLGVALVALGEAHLAEQTFDAALDHLQRAGDAAGGADVALQHARAAPADAAEAAWAIAARRCALAGRTVDELHARITAARIASARGDRARTLQWLHDLAPRLADLAGDDGTWARGELGSLWMHSGRAADAVPLLSRAAREEAAAGRRDVSARRLHQLQLCLAMLGQPT